MYKRRRHDILSSLIPSLRHSIVITSLNCLSFLVHPGSFLSFQSYCSLDSSYSSSPLLGILWSCVYSFFALWASETAAPNPVLDALQFWMPSFNTGSFITTQVSVTFLQYWLQNQRERHYKINKALLVLGRTHSFHSYVVSILDFPK